MTRRAAALLGLAFATPASTLHAEAEQLTTLAAYPATVRLETASDLQRVIVIGTDGAGIAHDLALEAAATVRDERIVTIDDWVLTPVSDGTTTLTITHGDRVVDVEVTVTGALDTRPISFRLDVMPVFMASGCNSGACHGSARGQDGFRLSLFGFDPAGDWYRIAQQMPGRRIDTAFATSSLLLEKSIGAVPHTGGTRFERDDPRYAVLQRWIEAGGPLDGADAAQVTGITLSPPEAVLAAAGATLPLVVQATYSDGTDRDVTDLAVFRSNNEPAASVTSGAVRTSDPGEAFVTASFDTHTVGSPLIILADAAPFELVDPAGEPAPGTIDDLVNRKLRNVRINPAPLCSDETFVRRAFLDITGLAPTPAERAAFLADDAGDKRAALVDELIGRRSFVDQWVMQWAELLQIRSNRTISPKAALRYFEWVRSCLGNDVPLDEMVRRILTSRGGTFAEPATNFYLNQPETIVLAENVAQAFMGVRIQCSQCHNHPFDRWTQDDYYGHAAFFPQIGRKRGEDPRESIVFNRGRGDVQHPVDGRVVPPKFLGGEAPDVRNKDRRAVFAEWLTSPDNPYFARSIANRAWAHFMGAGIVDPVDDFRVSNPPANEPLLEELARRLIESDYDLRGLVRDICTSHAYQRQTAAPDTPVVDLRNHAQAGVRRLRAETLIDVICQVTEAPEKFAGLPLGARAVEIADGTTSTYFLTTFGRAPRETVDAHEVVREPSLSQALHLLNGATVSRKIEQGDVVGRMLEGGATPGSVVDALYERCLCRAPTDTERAAALDLVDEHTDVKALLEDLFWAILNSREFMFTN